MVIATIAMLVAMVLVGSRNSRQTARDLRCTAAMKEIITLTRAYAEEYQFIPAPFVSQVPVGGSGFTLPRLLETTDGMWMCPDDPDRSSPVLASYRYHPGVESEDAYAWRIFNAAVIIKMDPTIVLFAEPGSFHISGRKTAYFDGRVQPWNHRDWIGATLP